MHIANIAIKANVKHVDNDNGVVVLEIPVVEFDHVPMRDFLKFMEDETSLTYGDCEEIATTIQEKLQHRLLSSLVQRDYEIPKFQEDNEW